MSASSSKSITLMSSLATLDLGLSTSADKLEKSKYCCHEECLIIARSISIDLAKNIKKL